MNARDDKRTSEQDDRQPSEGAAVRSAAARSRQATRERLLESGRQLFAKQGLHGVTTHDIAHGAEVAAGTFYLHFKNKREVFREIVDGSVGELIECIESAVEPFVETDDLAGVVRAQVEAMVDFAEDHREVIRMLFSADSGAAAVGSDVLDLLASTIAEGRRELMAAGVAPKNVDPAVLGQAMVGMCAQVLSWWSEDPSRVSRDALIESLTEIQRSGTHPV
ncbi:MAG: TetR/AcrR family transcriptional regulator [Myxococcota bacterium]|nr:TetR/AcrR family transcriptional regulator [Myxococcota bacterium]